MAVLMDENTKMICPGFTRSRGTFHTDFGAKASQTPDLEVITADALKNDAQMIITAARG